MEFLVIGKKFLEKAEQFPCVTQNNFHYEKFLFIFFNSAVLQTFIYYLFNKNSKLGIHPD